MFIKTLPDSTVSLLGSTQVLTGPDSFVKELVENALDAQATSISVEISANTLDVIQVQDNGHGIAPLDRALLCQRHCTSKIRDYLDIANVSNKFFGFRGEALASAVELCDVLLVTTKCVSEDAACLVRLDRHRKPSFERVCHQCGTTVRVENLFARLPVRALASSKPAAILKCLEKIKNLLQAYIFAQPTVRFSFKIRKAGPDKKNWIYVPAAEASMRDAALGVIGHACVSQCQLLESIHGDYRVSAFLPLMTADVTKINNVGHFVSIDGRPVRTIKGALRQIAAVFRERLRSSSHHPEQIKDPFMSMNISCPPGSYDINIEPAKDDVAFTENDTVLTAVNILLDKAYPRCENEDVFCSSVDDHPTIGESSVRQLFDSVVNTNSFKPDGEAVAPRGAQNSSLSRQSSRVMHENIETRTRMGKCLSGEPSSELEDDGTRDEEEEASSPVKSTTLRSNPWVNAKLNSQIKPKRSILSISQDNSSYLHDRIGTKSDSNFRLLDNEKFWSRAFGGLPTPTQTSSPCRMSCVLEGRQNSSFESSPLAEGYGRAREDDPLTIGENDLEMLSSQPDQRGLINNSISTDGDEPEVTGRLRKTSAVAPVGPIRCHTNRGTTNRVTLPRWKGASKKRAVHRTLVSPEVEQQKFVLDCPEPLVAQKMQKTGFSARKRRPHKIPNDVDVRRFTRHGTGGRCSSIDWSKNVLAENTGPAEPMLSTHSKSSPTSLVNEAIKGRKKDLESMLAHDAMSSSNSKHEFTASDDESLPPDMSLPHTHLRIKRLTRAAESAQDLRGLKLRLDVSPAMRPKFRFYVPQPFSYPDALCGFRCESSINSQDTGRFYSWFCENVPESVLRMWSKRVAELLIDGSLLPRAGCDLIAAQLLSMITDALRAHNESFS